MKFLSILTAVFVAFVLLMVGNGRLPVMVLGLYCSASVVAYLVYALDKSAARRGQRRIRESSLHLLALAGGWPGAWVAQRLLRHKSAKPSFQAVFRVTVAVNCGALAWLLTPQGFSFLELVQ